MKRLIKEVCSRPDGKSFLHVIRTSTYASSAEHIKNLADRAFHDSAGDATYEDVDVVLYAGRHYAGTFGVEFHLQRKLEGYADIKELEYKK